MGVKILATMSNGEVWEIDSHPVAFDRASYYADKDTQKDASLDRAQVFKEEYEYALEDDYTLIDWAQNNMDAADLAKHARRVRAAQRLTFSELWNEQPALKLVREP